MLLAMTANAVVGNKYIEPRCPWAVRLISTMKDGKRMKLQENSMITSMTGFANVSVILLEHNGEQCSVDIEIKTFNSRFFEPTCKMPNALSSYEMDLISRMKSGLIRGRVYCTVRINSHGALLEKTVFSPVRVEEYLEASAYMKKQFGLDGQLTIADMMNLPQVFSSERAALSDDAVARFLAGVDQAVAQVIVARKQEGKSLLVDLSNRLVVIVKKMTEIEALTARLLVAQKEEVARCQQLAQEGDEAARALLPERLQALDKMDVHEEIVRFGSHVSAIERLLSDTAMEKGRKLDFTLQELMREVNTVTSKCTNYEMSTRAVDIKVEIEKIREQVQNIV